MTPTDRAHVEPIRVPPRPAVRDWSRRHGFTPELVARWTGFFADDAKELLESLIRPVPRYLRVNTLRTDRDTLAASLTERGFQLAPVEAPHEGLAVLRLDKEPFAVSATPEYLAGEAYLQDLASLTAPAALAARPGERILDMAAAPGGKTTAVAELTDDDAGILAVEPVPHRAAALTANLRRLGVHGTGVVVQGAESVPGEAAFDRIMLDAPCTGEGVLPRDDGRRTGSLDEHAALAVLQRSLVGHAVRLLKPGGTLVYSTCTFSPEECEEVVLHAADLGLEPEPLPFDTLNGVPLGAPLTHAGERVYDDRVRHARRVFPHAHKTLGFFVARFHKPEDWRPPADLKVPSGPEAARVARVGMGRDDPLERDPEAAAAPAKPHRPGSGVPAPSARVAQQIGAGDLATIPSAELRDLDPPEREAFEALVDIYGDGLLARLEETWAFKVLGRPDLEPRRRVVALKRSRLGDLAPYGPVFLGIPVATLARAGARPTLEGGRFLAPHATRRRVRVKEKGEQLFLYGRDLLEKSIGRADRGIEAGDEVLVLADATGRYLGLGSARRPLGGRARAGGDEVAVAHRLDLGLYLRAQQGVPE